MLIATWNVNGIRARKVRLLEWLAERKPDIVCLQELKVKDEEFMHDEIEKAGYHAVCVGQMSWNGVGILAKEKPVTTVREIPGAGTAGARYIQARVGGIEVASTYIPNGKTAAHPDYPLKLQWLEKLALFMEARADKDAPFFIAGDFNVCPTDLDSYLGPEGHGTIFHTDEERALIERITKSGLEDVYRAKYPSEHGFTFWDYRAGFFHKKLGMRIDFILASPPLAKRVKDVVVDREFRKKSKISKALPSDHAPLYAVLED